ncbi:uncharacterized protein LOC133841719 [Drosophila sulfurigaster albostrigata]|uniref:uncharacterized protein LOC133841719 n=1 Tax=Drosophila sulfurigaster albostrigata TaxID=89887 RepID=UPI002D21C1EF|nr:uncharacterized protein LOC133841719 [Drosophila sulfurigaster albostrigata]
MSLLLLFYWLILGLELLPMVRSEYQKNANLLCTQMLNTHLLEKCCGDSKPSNLLFENSNCEKFKDDQGACRYECIYNHYQLLHSNGSLNMPNVNAMILKLYPRHHGYHSYRLMLQESYEHCESLSATYHGLVQMYATLADPEIKCNKNALIYSKCTIGNIFLNCPMEFWQEMIPECADSRRLLAHCVRFLHGIDDLSSPAKTRTSNGSSSYKLKMRGLRQPTHWYTAFINWLVF